MGWVEMFTAVMSDLRRPQPATDHHSQDRQLTVFPGRDVGLTRSEMQSYGGRERKDRDRGKHRGQRGGVPVLIPPSGSNRYARTPTGPAGRSGTMAPAAWTVTPTGEITGRLPGTL